MDVVVLGTGSPLPDPHRAGPATLVRAAPTDHRPVAATCGYRIEHDGRAVVVAGDTVPCDRLAVEA